MATYEMNEAAIARLEAALRAQRDQYALAHRPHLSPGRGASCSSIPTSIEPSSPGDQLLPERSPKLDVTNVKLPLLREIASSQSEDPRRVGAPSMFEGMPSFARLPPLSPKTLGALCLLAANAILLLLFVNYALLPALLPMLELTPTRMASINYVAVPSATPQDESVMAEDPASGNLPTLSQPETPTTLPPAPVNQSAGRLDRQIELLLQQGNRFIAVGDLTAARVVFARAADAGSATAALAMAATYDPMMLAKLGAVGVGANVDKARSWYETAKLLGSPEAGRWLTSSHAQATAR